MIQDKYRYYITFNGTDYTRVQPSKYPVVSGEKDKHCHNFTVKCGTWKIKRNENPYVYDTLITAFATPDTAATQIMVKIELWDAWESYTSTLYQGYIALSGLKINKDTGVIEFDPVTIGELDWYNANKAKRYDLFKESAANDYDELTYKVNSVTEEYWVPFDGDYCGPTGFDSAIATIGAWVSGNDYLGGWYENSWARVSGVLYHCTSDVENSTVAPDVDTENWERIEDGLGGYVNIVYRFFRETIDLPYTGFIQGDGLFEFGFPTVINTYQNTSVSNCSKGVYYDITGTPTVDGSVTVAGTWGTGPVFPVVDVLNFLLGDSGYTVDSQFLTDPVNPLTGADPNPTGNLYLVHNKIIKGTLDDVEKYEVSLSELLSDLCEMFRLRYYFAGASLVIEHQDYFEKGLSYGGTPVTYTNLTDTSRYEPKYQVITDLNMDGRQQTDNDYSFDGEAPEFETWHVNDGYDYDGEIRYLSAYCKKGATEAHSINLFITDFAYILSNSEGSSDDTCTLLACDSKGVILRETAGLRWRKGTIYSPTIYAKTATDYPNGPLMWVNILSDYHTYYPVFDTLYINGNYYATETDTRARIKRQREIRFPRKEYDQFNPHGLITTNMGDGQVTSYELDLDTDFIKVNMIY